MQAASATFLTVDGLGAAPPALEVVMHISLFRGFRYQV